MRTRFEQTVAATALVISMALGTVARGALGQTKRETCMLTVPYDLETQLAMRALAQAVTACYSQALPEDRLNNRDSSYNIAGILVSTRGSSKVAIRFQSVDRVNGRPNPDTVEMVEVSELPDGNPKHQASLELVAYSTPIGWATYWAGGNHILSTAHNRLQVDGRPTTAPDTTRIESVRRQTIADMLEVASTLPGSPAPEELMPVYE